MPWEIVKKGEEYCVLKSGTDEIEGCHETRGDAADQIAALNASEAESSVRDNNTFNYKEFNMELLNEIASHLKMALRSMNEDEAHDHVLEALMLLKEKIRHKEEHQPEEIKPVEYMQKPHFSDEEVLEQIRAAGNKEEYAWEGPIVFEGVMTGDNRVFKPGSISWDEETLPWAFRWQKSSIKGHDGAVAIGRVDKLERRDDGTIYGFGVIIPTLNDEAAEYLRLLESGVASGVSVDGDSAEFDVQETLEGGQRIEFSSMRLRSLTAVDIPAFNKARIELEEDDSDIEFGGKPSQGTEPDQRLAKNKKRKKNLRWAYNLTASAVPVKPKTEWFLEPKFDGPTPVTVTEDGSVYGHLALFDTCHIGLPGCVTPPKGSSYRYFHTGEIATFEGDTVDVGHLTFNTGHAAMSDSAKAAASHYDHTGTVAADVRAGEDEFGIWVVGALRSYLSEEEVRTFRAAPLSGDWRRIAGRLELVGALAVNVPGFPVPRARALVASGETEALLTFQESKDEPEVNAFEEGLRFEKRNQLSENVFHLIGQHDQGAHSGGKRGGGSHKGIRGAIHEGREMKRVGKQLRKDNPALKKVVKRNGVVKDGKLRKANLKNFSSDELGKLSALSKASGKQAARAKKIGIITINPITIGLASYKESTSRTSHLLLDGELKNRGALSIDMDNSFLVEFQNGENTKTLEQYIADAKAQIERGEIKKSSSKISAEDIKEVKEFIAAIIDDEDGDEEISVAIRAELAEVLSELDDLNTEESS